MYMMKCASLKFNGSVQKLDKIHGQAKLIKPSHLSVLSKHNS
jgi:hypothetical protein